MANFCLPSLWATGAKCFYQSRCNLNNEPAGIGFYRDGIRIRIRFHITKFYGYY